ncbi:MAG TPA: LysE family transporter [Hyphomicrobiaceae bacterium]|nr:LysE family transporter [Hyphomicrobiaceae bacterium]
MAYIPNPLIIPVGVVMGILLAMPFGPINLLGLQRALERGFFGGMAAAIGIMAADGTIALGAALGVNAISGAIREYRTAIQLVGGAALLAFGVNLWVTKATIVADAQADKASLRDYVWDIPKMFFLTLTNPTAFLGLVAIFGGVSSFVEVESHIDAFTMVAAILGGSFLYWFVVSQFIAAIRHRLDVVRLGQINRIAGLILIGFGCVLIGEMVMKRFRLW